VADSGAQNESAATNATAPGARGGFGRGGFGRGQFIPPGPPAPVPLEVAMPRPTPDEVNRINANLKEFIKSSSDKELLKKYESLLMVQVPRDNPCIRPTAGGGLITRHQGFMNLATNSEFDILFLGDSITDLWNVESDPQGNPGGKRVFDKFFGDVKVANSEPTTPAAHLARRSPRALARLFCNCAMIFQTQRLCSSQFSRVVPARTIPIAANVKRRIKLSRGCTMANTSSSLISIPNS
jgi:hypothetical protein